MKKLRINLVTCPKPGWDERRLWIQVCWFLVQGYFHDARVSRASQAMEQLITWAWGSLSSWRVFSQQKLSYCTAVTARGREPMGPFPVFRFPTFQPPAARWACVESCMYIVSRPTKLGNITHRTADIVPCDLVWIYGEEKSRQTDVMCHHPIDQCFSNLNLHLNHPEILLKCRLCRFSRSGVGLESLHFKHVPRGGWCCWCMDNGFPLSQSQKPTILHQRSPSLVLPLKASWSQWSERNKS